MIVYYPLCLIVVVCLVMVVVIGCMEWRIVCGFWLWGCCLCWSSCGFGSSPCCLVCALMLGWVSLYKEVVIFLMFMFVFCLIYSLSLFLSDEAVWFLACLLCLIWFKPILFNFLQQFIIIDSLYTINNNQYFKFFFLFNKIQTWTLKSNLIICYINHSFYQYLY